MMSPTGDIRSQTERVRTLQDKEAPRYDKQMGLAERLLFEGTREWACARVEGRVLEVAVGTGRNLPYYPGDVSLTGVELSPEMLKIAEQRADGLGREADLRVGDAQALDFPDGSFDSVLLTFALCTIPDDRAAVEEIYRVLRPGGRLALVEHVGSPGRLVRAIQRVLEPLTLRLAADHLTREPLDHLRAVGFEIEEGERSKAGVVERILARRPAGHGGG